MKKGNCVLIHYGELSLKGRNRNIFELKLKENIENTTGGIVKKYRGYFVLEGGEYRLLSRVMGISWYAETVIIDNDINQIVEKVLKEVHDRIDSSTKTFGVIVKRPNKLFQNTSVETAAIVGKEICNHYRLGVDLIDPDITIFIEIADRTYIFFDKTEGLRGFPVDVSGTVLSLLSGGIDSPVSTYLMMKRGCHADLIHFHAYSQNGNVLNTKMYRIFKNLSVYQNKTFIYLVPFYLFESGILKLMGTDGYEPLLFRRFMVKVAEQIALKHNSKALVTGDSLGQVASQTLDNLALIKHAISIPLFQPLIAYDKQEIVDFAKKIDTYQLSIGQYSDCCSLLSKNPRTKAALERLVYLEKSMDITKIIDDTLDLVSVYVLTPEGEDFLRH